MRASIVEKRWEKTTKKERQKYYQDKLANSGGQQLSAHLRKKFGWKYWQEKDPEILRRIAKEKENFKQNNK